MTHLILLARWFGAAVAIIALAAPTTNAQEPSSHSATVEATQAEKAERLGPTKPEHERPGQRHHDVD